MKLETLAVHAGYSPDPTTKAVAVPIYQTVSYAFDDTQHGADLFDLKVQGNIYTRIGNPTQDVLEQRLSQLEGGAASLALASGTSAIFYAIITLAQAGRIDILRKGRAVDPAQDIRGVIRLRVRPGPELAVAEGGLP